MTNFDYLTNEPRFKAFSGTAVVAEKVFAVDAAACAVNCRRAKEFAVKWLYSVDRSLVMPYQTELVCLLNAAEFKKLIGAGISRRLDFLRTLGNNANHRTGTISKDQARLALENLFVFLDFIAHCYASETNIPKQQRAFNPQLLEQTAALPPVAVPEIDLEQLIEENKKLKEELTARREHQADSYVPKPVELSEYQTRKLYIDTMLQDAGWKEGNNWQNEFELKGMPNASGVGFADYVLFGDDGKPLAVIEAKKTCRDVAEGRQQAKLYADLLEQRYGQRPVIFLTNGFETRIWIDRHYPERTVATIYSKRDLEKEFNKQANRTSLAHIQISDAITNRYYQKDAIKAICREFDERNRRKALLVMATGSGKTRTIISLVDVLLRHGWIKNVLFLADRNSLVTQAKRSFYQHLPDLTVTNLCEEKNNIAARGVFSTYQTMMNCIDDTRDEEGKLFTSGHFDLIIIDEAHRSIYKKYQDIFNYFDALLVGLTATPRDEIDKNTYGIFDLEAGVPTYGYELAQAVSDGYLVDFVSVETKLKFIQQGIVYDELSEEEQEEYEDLFAGENEDLPEKIDSSAINEWVFNTDTIRKVLDTLMTHGIKVDYGNKIGKTIIFAKNHEHAEKIHKIWGSEYPHYPSHFCRVIDHYTNYAQSLIDDFSDPQKLPQIAVSVDMLDTGIDVEEVVNLVFFKKVLSKAKFWQMIGRGTRLCPGLIDGKDKSQFYIFDFCSNFDFFRINDKGKETPVQRSLQEQIFILKTEIVYQLQKLELQTEELIPFREQLVTDLVAKVKELNRENFAVRLHLKFVDRYSEVKAFEALTYENTLQIAEEIAPLILTDADDASAVRFDALMHGIELAYIVGKKYTRAKKDLRKKVRAIADISTIPEIQAQRELLDRILNTDYVETAGINEFEHIREKLRDLMKYIPPGDNATYDTNFDDDILDVTWNQSELENDDLKNYKLKVNHYIRTHQGNEVIAKLKTNLPLTPEDVKELEKILWSEVGTQKDYENEYGNKPLGELVREIVGLDMRAAKEAFSKYLSDVNLDQRQIYFLNQIINYIVANGMMKDFSILQESPFTDMGGVSEVFFNNKSLWAGIHRVIETINTNAIAI